MAVRGDAGTAAYPVGMVLLDIPQFERWIATARRQVAVARHTASGEFHEAAVLHAEQAAQCALKALLHGVGAVDQARGHALLDLVERGRVHAGLVVETDLQQGLAELGATYQPSRYPDALAGGTPAGHYGEAISTRSLATAEHVLAVVDAHFSTLRSAAGDDDVEGTT